MRAPYAIEADTPEVLLTGLRELHVIVDSWYRSSGHQYTLHTVRYYATSPSSLKDSLRLIIVRLGQGSGRCWNLSAPAPKGREGAAVKGKLRNEWH
jgi:hypothetical protein